MRIPKEEWHSDLDKRIRPFAIICPFHEERTPSCIIYPSKGLFACFGCGTEGYIGDDDSLFTED